MPLLNGLMEPTLGNEPVEQPANASAANIAQTERAGGWMHFDMSVSKFVSSQAAQVDWYAEQWVISTASQEKSRAFVQLVAQSVASASHGILAC